MCIRDSLIDSAFVNADVVTAGVAALLFVCANLGKQGIELLLFQHAKARKIEIAEPGRVRDIAAAGGNKLHMPGGVPAAFGASDLPCFKEMAPRDGVYNARFSDAGVPAEGADLSLNQSGDTVEPLPCFRRDRQCGNCLLYTSRCV